MNGRMTFHNYDGSNRSLPGLFSAHFSVCKGNTLFSPVFYIRNKAVNGDREEKQA
jgi:hypothetical protein